MSHFFALVSSVTTQFLIGSPAFSLTDVPTPLYFPPPPKPVSYFSKVSVQCSLVKICQVVFEQASLFQTDDTLLMNFCWQVLTVSCHTHTGTAPSDGFKFTFNFCFIGR